jgi:replicative DNA helicase
MMTNVTPLRPAEAEAEIRVAPHNTEAEQALLGAIFRNNLAYARVSDFLEAEHFANAIHARIYAAIGKLIERGQVGNPVTLKNLFDQDGALAEIGGAQYLTRLAESAITIINVEDYGRRIHDLHLRRHLIGLGEDVVNDAFRHDLDDDAAAQIERAEARLFELASAGSAGRGGPVQINIDAAVRRAELARKGGGAGGIKTGFVDIDQKLGGLRPSQLIVLAARPSMGKTSLATNIAFRIASAGTATGFFSLEMSAEEIEDRILAEQTGIPADRIRRGATSTADFDRFVAASQRLAALPLYIDETQSLSVAALRPRTAAQAAKEAGAHSDRLFAVNRAAGQKPRRKSGAGGVRNHPRPQGNRQGARGARPGLGAIVARRRAARGQAAPTRGFA